MHRIAGDGGVQQHDLTAVDVQRAATAGRAVAAAGDVSVERAGNDIESAAGRDIRRAAQTGLAVFADRAATADIQRPQGQLAAVVDDEDAHTLARQLVPADGGNARCDPRS